MEDKQEICNLLCETLAATRDHEEIQSIIYKKEQNKEIAVVSYINGGSYVVNVSMDSGTAMIRDIMEAIK